MDINENIQVFYDIIACENGENMYKRKYDRLRKIVDEQVKKIDNYKQIISDKEKEINMLNIKIIDEMQMNNQLKYQIHADKLHNDHSRETN